MAHAQIVGIDVKAARKAAGVHAVFTGADMEGVGGIPTGWLIHSKDGSPMVEPPHPALATDKVRYVGDCVAVVVADTKEQARAAAALVEVDSKELPAVATIAAATAKDAPLVWDEAPGNVCYDWEIGDKEAVADAFANAAHVVSIAVVNQRLVPNAIEPRAALADFDPSTGGLHPLHHQPEPHLTRLLLGAFVLGVPEHKLRVVAPDVGGGFGSKIPHYAEEAILTWTAGKLGRPVKWTCDRMDAFKSDTPAATTRARRSWRWTPTAPSPASGSPPRPTWAPTSPPSPPACPRTCTASSSPAPYTTPAIYVEVKALFTNTVPVDALRGAGRPEATYLLERLVEKAARATGIDRVELRRRNFVREFPYQTPVALQYDQGDYDATLDLALEAAEWDGFEARREEAAARGKLRGIGVSTFIEACGIAPSAVVGSLGARRGSTSPGACGSTPRARSPSSRGPTATARATRPPSPRSSPKCSAWTFDAVEVVHGDSAKIPFGMGTYGSRSLAVGGAAICKAVEKVVAKGKKIAAHLMEASVEDVEFADGTFTVAGTDRSRTIGEVALTAYVPHNYPEGLEPGLEETAFYDPLNFTFPAGTHVAEVEIDPETGEVELARIACSDDVGRIVNPMIVAGQLHGGLAHGIGQALLEECRYEENGQPATASFMNYAMPRAADLPSFDLRHNTTLCTHNPLGAKGVGEVGSIGVPPAVINAVLDALRPLGVTEIEMPATSQRVWQAIQTAKRA